MAKTPEALGYVTLCPNCRRLVEAREFLGNAAMLGFLESVLPIIDCDCGYEGLPVKLRLKDYERLVGLGKRKKGKGGRAAGKRGAGRK